LFPAACDFREQGIGQSGKAQQAIRANFVEPVSAQLSSEP